MKAKIIVTLYIKNVTEALYTVNYNMSATNPLPHGVSNISQKNFFNGLTPSAASVSAPRGL